MVKTAFTFFILLILSQNSFAQNDFDFKQFYNEGGNLYKQPVNWNAGEWLIAGGIAASTFLIMHVDEDVREAALKNPKYKNNLITEFGRYWGEPYVSLPIGIFFLAYGISQDNEANKRLGFEITQSFFYSILTTQIIKISLGRARPFTDEGAFSFNPPELLSNRNWSMPSGHTTIAFSFSTVLAENADKSIWKVLAYVPAFLTAGSRVYQDRHWASDVFLGAVIGYSTAKFLTELHNKNEVHHYYPLIKHTNLVSVSLRL